MSMWFGVLGRLEVRRSGAPPLRLAPQLRLLLCALLLEANTVVSDDSLSHLLWEHPLDEQRQSTLFRLVSKLRETIGASRQAPIIRSSGGYCLQVAAADVDAMHFEHLRARGVGLCADRPAQAARVLAEAEALWRDRAYADVIDRPEFDTEAERLDELRRTCREHRLEALLALGRHQQVLDEMAPLGPDEPVRETTLHPHLLALYRSGRKVEACQTYERLWRRLRQERLEPGPRLAVLYERMLADDPVLALDAPPGGKPRAVVPALPPAAQVALDGPPFVGGDGRAGALDRIDAERAGVVVVRGEPGSGKTRLVAELARRSHERDETVLWGNATVAAAVPYQPFLRALAPLLDVGPGDDSRMILDRLYGADDNAPDRPAPAARHGLFEAVVDLLRSATAHADVVLVIDDLQWIGNDGLALWHHVLRAQPLGLTLVVTIRSSPDDAEPNWLVDRRSEGRLTVVDLTGLGPAAVAELARHVGRELPPGGAEELVARTDGNAFFVVMLLGQPSVLDLDPDGDLETPILSSFRRLPAPSRRALEAASLVGQAFDADRVAGALGHGDWSALLAPALEAGIVRRTGPGSTTLVFRHDIVRDAVRGLLDPARTADLHAVLGRAGEANLDAAVMGRAAALADNFAAAAGEDLDRVIRYSVVAGDEHRGVFAHGAAAHYYRRAVDAAALAHPEDRRRRCRLLLRLGEAQRLAYSPIQARLSLVEAAVLALELAAVDELDRAITELVWVHEFGDTQSDARDVVARASRLPDLPARRRALYAAARARIGGLPAADADRLLDQAEQLARDAAPERLLGLVLATGCLVRWRPETLSWRRRVAEEVHAIGERTGSGELVIESVRLGAAANMESGDLRAALDGLSRFVELAAGSGRPPFDAAVAQAENSIDLMQGRFAAVEARLPRLLDGVAESANFAGAYALQLHHLRREQGRGAETLPMLRSLLDDSRFPAVRVAVSLAELERGNGTDGRAELDRAVAGGLGAYPRDWLWMTTMAELAEAAALAEHVELAGQLHAHLAPFADQLVVAAHNALCLGSAHRFVGIAAVAAGAHEEGIAHLRAALRVDDALDAGPAVARDLLALGRALSPLTRGPHDVVEANRAFDRAGRRARHLRMAEVATAATREAALPSNNI